MTNKTDNEGAKMQSFEILSGYGLKTRAAFVEIVNGDFKTQMSPQEARSLGLNLIQAAEAAESDAFLVEFSMDKVGLSQPEAAGLIDQFRQWREALWQEKYGIDMSPPVSE